jgi:hypothetical protein
MARPFSVPGVDRPQRISPRFTKYSDDITVTNCTLPKENVDRHAVLVGLLQNRRIRIRGGPYIVTIVKRHLFSNAS